MHTLPYAYFRRPANLPSARGLADWLREAAVRLQGGGPVSSHGMGGHSPPPAEPHPAAERPSHPPANSCLPAGGATCPPANSCRVPTRGWMSAPAKISCAGARAAGRGGGPALCPALCMPRLQAPGRAPGPALPGARAAKCAGYRQAIVWASLRCTHLRVYVCYRFLLRLYSVVMILIVGNCAKWE